MAIFRQIWSQYYLLPLTKNGFNSSAAQAVAKTSTRRSRAGIWPLKICSPTSSSCPTWAERKRPARPPPTARRSWTRPRPVSSLRQPPHLQLQVRVAERAPPEDIYRLRLRSKICCSSNSSKHYYMSCHHYTYFSLGRVLRLIHTRWSSLCFQQWTASMQTYKNFISLQKRNCPLQNTH